MLDLKQDSLLTHHNDIPSSPSPLFSSSHQDRRDLVSSHSSGSLGPITSLSGSSFGSGARHGHSSADFQPPYFPPPYNHQPDFSHHAAVVAAASDPYGHLNSLAGNHQQYHQLHPAAQAARGHNVLSRRDDDIHLQSHMHSSSLPTSVYSSDGINSVSNMSVSARRGAEMVYASVRRPDVLMHSSHHHGLSEQDLLNLQNAGSLALEDAQVSTNGHFNSLDT